MTRKETNLKKKYPETNSFHWFNANPKGQITGDCVVRALSLGMGKDYYDVLKGLFDISVETGYSVASKEDFGLYLERNGWTKMPQLKKTNGTKYTGEDFCEYLNHNGFGNVMANIGGHHIVCFKEVRDTKGAVRYKVHDIWNSTDGCVGNWWVKVKMK